MTRFTSNDRLLHDIAGFEHGRESYVWATPLPGDGVVWFTYLWTHAGTGLWSRFIGVGGPDVDQPLVVDFAGDVEMIGDSFADCEIGGLRIRQAGEIGTAALSYDSKELSFELNTTGRHTPFSWHEGHSGCADWAAHERYELSTHSSGLLKVAGRDISFDTFGHHDHSWGSRDWRALQHWKWINIGTAGASVHAWESFALGERQVNGYVNRGGQVSPITSIATDVKYDTPLIQAGVSAEITDATGRVTNVRMEGRATWRMPIGHHFLTEVAMESTIDEEPGIGIAEVGFPQDYVNAYAAG